MDYKNFQPHEMRVVEERRELLARLEKLTAFLRSASIFTLDSEDQCLLNNQQGAMFILASILGQRIQRFEQAAANRGAQAESTLPKTAFSGYVSTQPPHVPLALDDDTPLAPPACPLDPADGSCEACQ